MFLELLTGKRGKCLQAWGHVCRRQVRGSQSEESGLSGTGAKIACAKEGKN